MVFRQLFGIALILIAWFNYFALGDTMRIVAFVIGFDLLTLFPKFLIFGLDYFIGLSGLGWILILSIIAELIAKMIFLGKFINYILKPAAIFIILYTNGITLDVSAIVAGLDLLINMTKK